MSSFLFHIFTPCLNRLWVHIPGILDHQELFGLQVHISIDFLQAWGGGVQMEYAHAWKIVTDKGLGA